MGESENFSVYEKNRLLEVRDLHLHFEHREGIVQALKGVNFEVFKGETLGLVGESGCGKSVTAKSILQIIPANGKIKEGKILYRRLVTEGSNEIIDIAKLDQRSTEMREIRRKEISIIFQEPMTALSPIHTVGDQIIESIRLKNHNSDKKNNREKAINMLSLVGIPNPELRLEAYTFELSGGMRQRVMIAMALASDPNLIIADEPTTAIDVTIQAQIIDLIKALQKKLNMSVIFITHDLGVIAEISDRVAVMYLGKVIEKGKARDIYYNPKHPYTKGLLNSIPDIAAKKPQRLWAIKGNVPNPYQKISGCEFHPRCSEVINGKCTRIEPEDINVSAGHKVNCLLYSKGEKKDDQQ